MAGGNVEAAGVPGNVEAAGSPVAGAAIYGEGVEGEAGLVAKRSPIGGKVEAGGNADVGGNTDPAALTLAGTPSPGAGVAVGVEPRRDAAPAGKPTGPAAP